MFVFVLWVRRFDDVALSVPEIVEFVNLFFVFDDFRLVFWPTICWEIITAILIISLQMPIIIRPFCCWIGLVDWDQEVVSEIPSWTLFPCALLPLRGYACSLWKEGLGVGVIVETYTWFQTHKHLRLGLLQGLLALQFTLSSAFLPWNLTQFWKGLIKLHQLRHKTHIPRR